MWALVGLATAALGFVSATLGAVVSIRNGRKSDEIHVLVNSQLTAVIDRVAQLTAALDSAGVPVPDVIDP
jgi:hypothetical protein